MSFAAHFCPNSTIRKVPQNAPVSIKNLLNGAMTDTGSLFSSTYRKRQNLAFICSTGCDLNFDSQGQPSVVLAVTRIAQFVCQKLTFLCVATKFYSFPLR